ncbi:MAG: DUF4365 domain-containing protein [Anaerolineae bacterium]|nr:DUF4365 domain-containing protein [Anaerolineae bacterium]
MAKSQTGSRFTNAMKQELISRRQLSERLIKFGWMPNDPTLDLGEDFIVHVYLGNRATGVTFHIQEKSVSNLPDRLSASGDFIVYGFDVKDIKYWETFDSPVVLVVWDIKLEEGRWVLVDSAISDLDKRCPNWRGNKTKASIHIPWNNTTDNAGLTSLKQCVGRRWYPMIFKGKTLEIKVKLRFPDTEEGKTNLEMYEKFVKEGAEATFIGSTIQTLEFSDWWGKWFGDYNPDKVMLVVGGSVASEIHPVSIAMIGGDSSVVALSNVELKNVRSGTEVLRVTNAHQETSPIHFKFTFTDPRKHKECSMSYQLNNWGNDAYEALNILKFLRSLMSGGKLTLTFLNRDDAKVSLILPSQSMIPTNREVELFEQICRIQDKSGHIIRIPKDGITREDEFAIRELAQIFEFGQTSTKHNTVTVSGSRDMLEVMSDQLKIGSAPVSIRATYPESFVKLFGIEIKTGRMIRTAVGSIEMTTRDIQHLISTSDRGDSVKVEIVDAEVIEEFPDIVEKINVGKFSRSAG